MSDHSHAPAALPVRKNTDLCWIESFLSFRVVMEFFRRDKNLYPLSEFELCIFHPVTYSPYRLSYHCFFKNKLHNLKILIRKCFKTSMYNYRFPHIYFTLITVIYHSPWIKFLYHDLNVYESYTWFKFILKICMLKYQLKRRYHSVQYQDTTFGPVLDYQSWLTHAQPSVTVCDIRGHIG